MASRVRGHFIRWYSGVNPIIWIVKAGMLKFWLSDEFFFIYNYSIDALPRQHACMNHDIASFLLVVMNVPNRYSGTLQLQRIT
jgi:hypothetical protein